MLKPNKTNCFWLVVFATTMLKYAYYGYTYFPVVDDNNMYGVFRQYSDTFNDVIMRYKMYSTRPVAVLMDAYIWAKLWDTLWLSLVIMTFLHFATAYLLYKVFEKCRLPFGMPVIIVFTLLPLGSEASYWLAASSRIVAGMFFMALSLYILCQFFEHTNVKNRLSFAALFAMTHLISYGFYEQVIVLGFCAAFLVIAAHWKHLKTFWWLSIIPVTDLGMTVYWYKRFSTTGNMADRGEIIHEKYMEHFGKVNEVIQKVWDKSWEDLYKVGFRSGLDIIMKDRSFIFLIAVFIVCAGIFIISYKEKIATGIIFNLVKILLGVTLFFIPFFPFYPMKLIWICNRNFFTSFIGLGLIFEGVLNIFARHKILSVLRSTLITVAAFVFLIANVYELNYYKNIWQIDREIVTKIASSPGMEKYFLNHSPFVLFNAKPSYVDPLSYRIGNCTGSSWALQGAIQAHLTVLKSDCAVPVPKDTPIYLDKNILESAILLGIDEEKYIFPVRIAKKLPEKLFLSTGTEENYGTVDLLQNDIVYFKYSP